MRTAIIIPDKYINKFWKFVDIIDLDSCWTWIRSKNTYGYGQLYILGKQILVHRISWMIYFGGIPDGLCVLHKCDNPSCVNPKHLFLGTSQENAKDRDEKHRNAYGERHGMSKLSEKEIIKIRKLRFDGYTIVKLGKIFGVDHTMISNICRNKNWKHI